MIATQNDQRAEAIKLCSEGVGVHTVSRQLGVSSQKIHGWTKPLLTCKGCKTKLLLPSPDGLCGFCQVEVGKK